MKAFYTFFLVPLLVLTGCKHDRENPNQISNGKITFSPALLDPDSRIAQSLPAGAHLQISIETSEGAEVLTQHQMDILVFNGALVSIALELGAGDYLLTEFLVLSQENDILYATPLESSPLADLVNDPIPISFSVVGNEAVQVEVQVLNIALLTPADIGYVSFPFTIVNHFFLTVFKQTESGLSLTDATGYILQNADTLKTFEIEAEINTVTFLGEPADVFTLVVLKSGFGKHTESFTIDGLLSGNEEGVGSVTLHPAFTFVTGYGFFRLDLGFTGSLTVDWGDGTTEVVYPSSDFDELNHEYSLPGSYFASVTGDIQTIFFFKAFYGLGPMSEIDVSHLAALTSFISAWSGSESPKLIDLSHNLLLTRVDVSLSRNLEELILPETNVISSLDIGGNTNLTTDDVENLIDVLYVSVVANDRQDGYVSLVSVVDQAVAGPPSATSLVKLRSLYNDYNWYVDPEFLD